MINPYTENQKEIASWRNKITKIKQSEISSIIYYFEKELEHTHHMKQIDHENESLEVDILSYEENFRNDFLKERKIDFFTKLLFMFDQIVQKYNEDSMTDIFFKVFPHDFFPAEMKNKPFYEFLKFSQYKDVGNIDFGKNLIIKVNKFLNHLRALEDFISSYITEIILKLDLRLIEVTEKEVKLLKACFCYNITLRTKFVLFQYLHLLVKIKFCSRSIKFKEIKLKQIEEDKIFEGLESLHQRIMEEDVQFVLRQLTYKKMKDKGDFSKQKNATGLEEINFKQFLIHLIYQLEINLEFIFTGRMREIVKFFDSIEEFSKLAFGLVSIDLKCDIFRLTIRITNSFSFISKLELVNYLKLEFFESHPSYKLFYEVYESEIEY